MPNERTPKPNPERNVDRGDDPQKNPPKERASDPMWHGDNPPKGHENILHSDYERSENKSSSQDTPTPPQREAFMTKGKGPEEQRDRGQQHGSQGVLGEAADRGKDSVRDQADKEKEARGPNDFLPGNAAEQNKQQEQKGDRDTGSRQSEKDRVTGRVEFTPDQDKDHSHEKHHEHNQ